MLKHFLVSTALAGATLVAPAALSLPASAAVQVNANSIACTYGRSGNHWNCITPGAYCPAAAHGKYGYAKTTNRRYKCSQYDKGTWRWKRA